MFRVISHVQLYPIYPCSIRPVLKQSTERKKGRRKNSYKVEEDIALQETPENNKMPKKGRLKGLLLLHLPINSYKLKKLEPTF